MNFSRWCFCVWHKQESDSDDDVDINNSDVSSEFEKNDEDSIQDLNFEIDSESECDDSSDSQHFPYKWAQYTNLLNQFPDFWITISSGQQITLIQP